MKKETSSNLLEKIDVAKERIKELETMINHWEAIEVEGFWDAECSINPSSPACLLFNNWPSIGKTLSQLANQLRSKAILITLLVIKN